MRVVLAGGTGHVGQALVRGLEPLGWELIVVSRSAHDDRRWDGKTLGPWTGHLEGADVVINLAGRSVNCRYSAKNLGEMMSSRIDSTRVVGEAIAAATNPPRLWLQASTATIYSHRFDAPNDELTGVLGGNEQGSPPKWRASVEIAKRWEQELELADTPKTRKVAMRSAITLSPDEGSVFCVMASLARKGLGGAQGSGKQWVSWIHEHDFVAAVRFLIDHEEVQGPINICSPIPIANKQFWFHLRRVLKVKFGPKVPAWLLEGRAFMMGTETELLLKSRRVVPTRLLRAGFEFRYPTWTEAVAELVSQL